jgi:competence protein ComEC
MALRPPAPLPQLTTLSGVVTGTRYLGHQQAVDIEPRGGDLRGRLPSHVVVIGPRLPALRPGDMATWQGLLRWEEPRPPRTSGHVRLDAVMLLSVQRREDGLWGAAWQLVNQVAPERRELAGALLLGRGRPPERQDFRQSGLLHLLAVSGQHLAIALGGLALLLRWCGLPWGLRLGLLTGLALAYTAMTGASLATQRAAAMCLAVAACGLTGREPHRLGPLSLAVCGLLFIDPGHASDLGFQLSAAAVLGIMTLGRDLVELRQRFLPLTPWPLDQPSWRLGLLTARAAGDGLAIGLGATLATAPLLAWHFGSVNPWGPLTTLVATPAVTVAVALGTGLLPIVALWPGGPWEGPLRILEWHLDTLAAIAHAGARLPWAQVAAPAPTPVLLFLTVPLLVMRVRTGTEALWRVAAIAVWLAGWALVG